jgi:hypothetical protein
MNRYLVSAWMCLLLFSGAIVAADEAPAYDPTQDFALRIRQLEEQTAAMQAELSAMRQATPASSGAVSSETVPVNLDTMADPPYEGALVSREDMLEEMRSLVWTKGDYKVVPYGVLWGSGAYDSQRSYPGPFALYVISPQFQHVDEFVLDTRRTRVGIDVTGPRIPRMWNGKSRGKIEIDFHGAITERENQATIQIRHAYAEVYDDNYRLLAGQTWDLNSPLQPRTINYSVGWGVGNLGFRRMQIRYERYMHFSDVFLVSPAIAVCQNIVLDGPTLNREPSDWPVIEGRCGFTLGPRGEGDRPVVFGMSGHIGEQMFDFPPIGDKPLVLGARVQTWSANADVAIPITNRCKFQGEFFTGADLTTFMGGIIQGVDFSRREAVCSTGGWFDVGYDLRDDLHVNAGYLIDDPWNDTVSADAESFVANGARVYNSSLFANTIFDVTKKMKLGLETSVWTTHYKVREPGNMLRFEFSGAYEF